MERTHARRRVVVNERSLFPLSVVVGLLGVAMWVGSLRSQVERNTEDIVRARNETADERNRIADRLSNIDQRLSTVQGALETLLDQKRDAKRKQK